MTPEAQRIAIAKARGKLGCWPHEWEKVQRFTSGYVNPPYEPRGGIPYERFECKKCKKEVVIPDFDDTIKNLPDYLSDLNAMHEAEKARWTGDLKQLHNDAKTYAEWRHYQALLRHNIHATAAQRAEAFLKTLNLWKP